MATTIDDLASRIDALEQALDRLRQKIEDRWIEETAAQRGAQMLREAKDHQTALSAAFARMMEDLGITGEPIGAENLQKMIAAEGIIKPEDNEFSRGIIEMREE